ncbi:hypothetical protein Tco_1280745 [Tanacetum coccineum]
MSLSPLPNFLGEFWCTEIAYDPNPPADETQSHPLKEYLIKFSVMNSKKSLTLDFKTFTSSTGLDYNNSEYVSYLSPEAVKAELAKIITNLSYLDKTHVLKNSFPAAWRILFTFVIQFLDENYSSTKKINYIQQMIAYCLMNGTKGHMGKRRFKPPVDMELLTTNVTNQTLVLTNAADVQALLLSDDEPIEESEDEVFEAKDEIYEEVHHTNE